MKPVAVSLLLAGLPTLAAACAEAADPAGCAPPPAVERPSPDGSAGEDYWTPERLRNARPREMHPTGPLERSSPAPPCPSAPTGAPGSPGTGEVEPDPSNLIMPPAPDER